MTRAIRLILISVLVPLGGCAADQSGGTLQPEAISLLGEPLYAPELPLDTLLQRGAELNTAHSLYLVDETNEQSIIWFGRRLAYLGRYHEAIDVYTAGLVHHPDSYRLLRHRGHRFISIRRLDDAIADLSRASELIEGVPDAIEPDGQPNAQNIPTSTTHTNIYYHLGLAHYLKGQFEPAREAYVKCLDISTNDDTHCASAYWIVICLRRLGLPDIAESVLEDISPDMEIIENFAYHDLLLMFKGERTTTDLMTGVEDGIQNATLAYGIAVWFLIYGDTEEAANRFQQIVRGEQWAAFGYLAAETELARIHP